MNAEAITLLAFLSILFLLSQIRFIRRFISIRRRYENLPGVLFMAEAIGEGCSLCFDCCASGAEEIEPDVISFEVDFEHDEEKREKAISELKAETRESERAEALMERSHFDVVEEKMKVIDLVSKRQKTSILYVSNITKIPKERIFHIITENPDFTIENEYIINKRLITDTFCPECKNPVKPGLEFCTACGFKLK